METMTTVGARRGTLAGALLAGALPTYVIVSVDERLSFTAFFNVLTLGLAAVGAVLGAVCGALAGHLIDDGSTWARAAATSATTAAALVLLVSWTATGFEIGYAFLWPAAPLVLGSAVIATWQSWSLQRRQDRGRAPARSRRDERPVSP